jgi:hypothetical protein
MIDEEPSLQKMMWNCPYCKCYIDANFNEPGRMILRCPTCKKTIVRREIGLLTLWEALLPVLLFILLGGACYYFLT